ncbi:hypothetical protein HYV82_00200 [Candidatus Woesearchaeota archaeon]|nr:hypothetical protein [Candidatus Woesearchaeota archaeon]
MQHKRYEHSKDFVACEVCDAPVSKLEYDSPLYCDKCIAEMEKRDMSPRKYRKYLELKDTLNRA